MALKLRGDTIIDEAGKTLLELTNQVANMMQNIYPVGSIYMSTTNKTNPKNILGFGTWEQVVGRYILAWDVEGGQTGGSWDSESVKLTINQIPSHNHPMLANKTAGGQNAGIQHTWGTAYQGYDDNSCGHTGGGQGHSHRIEPPWLKVYLWKRTA